MKNQVGGLDVLRLFVEEGELYPDLGIAPNRVLRVYLLQGSEVNARQEVGEFVLTEVEELLPLLDIVVGGDEYSFLQHQRPRNQHRLDLVPRGLILLEFVDLAEEFDVIVEDYREVASRLHRVRVDATIESPLEDLFGHFELSQPGK